VGVCDYLPAGTVGPIDLVLTQNQDQVIGRFYLGELSADAVGPVAANGELTLTGKVTSDPFTIDVATAFQSTTPGQITGSLGQLWLGTGWSGNLTLMCTITSLNRTSATPNEPSFAGLRLATPTIQDMIRALLRR